MKLVALMSGGIDSPVAAYLMSEVGADVVLLHMDNRPFSDDLSIEKAEKLAQKLRDVTGKEFPLFFAEHGKSQTAIREHCGYYQCVMCKRVMMFVAAEFAKKNGCSGIIMGDSLGQVASQTLRNLRAETVDLDFKVVRPLIGMDKIEIEAIGKKIGTYDISIIKDTPCKAVPIKPATESESRRVLEFQSKLDFSNLISDSVNSISECPCKY